MIYGTLEHLERYESLSPNLKTGLRFLAETDFSRVPPGEKIVIDGDKVFALIQEYETKEANDLPEAHRKYADIQYLIDGEEWIGVAPLEDMTEEAEARPDGDIWFYRGPTGRVKIGGSRFAIFFPEDAHAPCIAAGSPVRVRKCVVKVMV